MAAERRGRTVPIADWWGVAVRRELEANRERGRSPCSQKELAEELDIEPAHLNRAIQPMIHKDWRPVDYIVIAVSDKLDLPYPFLLPETEDVARGLAKEHRLLRRTAEVLAKTTGVAGTVEKDQTPLVPSEHGSRSQAEPHRKSSTARADGRRRGTARAD